MRGSAQVLQRLSAVDGREVQRRCVAGRVESSVRLAKRLKLFAPLSFVEPGPVGLVFGHAD